MIWWRVLPNQLEGMVPPISTLREKRTTDQIWLREPAAMAKEEWAFYEEIFPYLRQYLVENQNRPMILEGAGLLPHLISSLDLDVSYLCITPSADFQRERYAKREWVPYVLQNSSNPQLAFDNWMNRDILFAQRCRREAERLSYPHLLTNGSRRIEEMTEQAADILDLARY